MRDDVPRRITVTTLERMHMRTLLRSISALVIVVAVMALAATYSVKASPQAGQAQDPIPALLAEVHALRIAMEQSVTVAPRVQLTLARLNIEEQRITQLAAQLDRARQELNGHSLALRRMSDELEEAEKRLQTIVENKPRRDLEVGISDLKTRIKAEGDAEQASRARENDALQALNTEQGRWIDLNSRLDELERLLGPVPR